MEQARKVWVKGKDREKSLWSYFPDWESFVAVASRPPREDARYDREARDKKERNGFCRQTFKEAMALATKGDPEGHQKARAYMRKVADKLGPERPLPIPSYDVTGDFLDVSRVCMNDPDAWGTWEDGFSASPVHGRCLNLRVSIATNCFTSEEAMRNRAAAMTALVLRLESEYYRVNVVMVTAITVAGNGASLTNAVLVPVKSWQEPPDGDRLAFALGHPAVLRQLIFCLWDSDFYSAKEADETSAVCRKSYGRAADLPEEKGILYVPSMEDSNPKLWTSPEETAKWIRAQLASYELPR